jgi:hypothetical protein
MMVVWVIGQCSLVIVYNDILEERAASTFRAEVRKVRLKIRPGTLTNQSQ